MSRPQNAETVLSVRALDVEYSTGDEPIKALRDIDLNVNKGETVGVAGESGSGKSTLAFAILQYLDSNGRITNGEIQFDGRDLSELSTGQLRTVRGNQIAHVPQDPKKSLNPSLEVGEQISETIEYHMDVSSDEAHDRTIEILQKVGIQDPEYNAKQYPHQLSGGMQQRILVAMALSCDPDLLILDEPTTGLDVTTQSKILKLIDELKIEFDTGVIIITHNLSVLSKVADRICILYAGEILEKGAVSQIFSEPANPYTKRLLSAIPELKSNKQLAGIPGKIPDLSEVPDGCIFADRCEFADERCRSGSIEMEDISDGPQHMTRCIRWETIGESATESGIRDTVEQEQPNENTSGTDRGLLEIKGLKKYYGSDTLLNKFTGGNSKVKAVDGISLTINESEIVGLVGESGCGKSTLGKTILNLEDKTDGSIKYRGEEVGDLQAAADTPFHQECRIVFQNPHSSLNPAKTIRETLERPIKIFGDLTSEERARRAEDMIQRVKLDTNYLSRYPNELSGGELQRVAIARAFITNPSFVLLDEPLSALDVSVQADILELLLDLHEEYDTSYLFISHNLGIINYISDRIGVMYLGKMMEIGNKDDIFSPPYHPYTEALISNVPSADPESQSDEILLEGTVPSARDPPSGCAFNTRCPKYIDGRCEREDPELSQTSTHSEHYIACHLDEKDME
jgi:peptide/nickel transport system ATP-binding protein